MTQVYVLLQTDYEDCTILGICTTQAQAQAMREALWVRCQGLAVESPAWWRLPHEVRATPTRDVFEQWHPIEAFTLDVEVTQPHGSVPMHEA